MKIICIGRNYAKHAEELNNPIPQEPVVFLKPDTAVLLKKHPFFIPEHSNNIHHEIELVVKINRLGKHIETRFAHKYYSEIALGIDFTARDVQDDCKKKGLPWEKAKAFDGSAAVSNFFSLESLKKEINNIDFYLDINGKKSTRRQYQADVVFCRPAHLPCFEILHLKNWRSYIHRHSSWCWTSAEGRFIGTLS